MATASGTYFILIEDSCTTISDTINVIITNDAPTVDLGDDISICIGDEITLDATSNTANTYLWQNGTTTPTLIIDSEGKYIVTAFNDCGRGMDSILVNLMDCNCYVSVPNAFTPNNDSKNDAFSSIIDGVCNFSNYQFMIFNRWGNLMFETTDITREWDGIYNNQAQPTDTYTWIIEYELENGITEILKGRVLLLR